MSDRATSNVLVALLRADLGTGPAPDADAFRACDWPRFERLASHHGLVPILYKGLQPHATVVPDDLWRRMQVTAFGNALRNQLAQSLLGEVATALHEQRIAVIVLKGAALLQTLYADDPSLRQLSDVDVLVDERDLERAGAQLMSIGLEPVGADGEEQRGPLCHIHTVYIKPRMRSLPVELHWRLFEPYLPYCFDLAEVRAHARRFRGLPENGLMMSPEHELAHLCIHLERHAIVYRSVVGREDWFELLLVPQGLGRLVWLYDIAAYVRRRADAVDWDRFVDCARRWAIDGRVRAVLELCRRALGVAPPPEVMRGLDRRAPRLTERLAHRVVFASYRAKEAQRFSTLGQLSGHVVRAMNTWASLFPPTAYLRARYPGRASGLAVRTAHLRQVIPGLYAEARERWRSSNAARHHRDP